MCTNIIKENDRLCICVFKECRLYLCFYDFRLHCGTVPVMFVFHFIYTIVYLVPGYGFRGPTNIADPASPLGGG